MNLSLALAKEKGKTYLWKSGLSRAVWLRGRMRPVRCGSVVEVALSLSLSRGLVAFLPLSLSLPSRPSPPPPPALCWHRGRGSLPSHSVRQSPVSRAARERGAPQREITKPHHLGECVTASWCSSRCPSVRRPSIGSFIHSFIHRVAGVCVCVCAGYY